MDNPIVGPIWDEWDFLNEVNKMRAAGWNDADYMARQIVDDHYRHTGASLHQTYQHIVEIMVNSILNNDSNYMDTISKNVVVFKIR